MTRSLLWSRYHRSCSTRVCLLQTSFNIWWHSNRWKTGPNEYCRRQKTEWVWFTIDHWVCRAHREPLEGCRGLLTAVFVSIIQTGSGTSHSVRDLSGGIEYFFLYKKKNSCRMTLLWNLDSLCGCSMGCMNCYSRSHQSEENMLNTAGLEAAGCLCSVL